MTSDSDSRPTGPRPEGARGGARQSGGSEASASPEPSSPSPPVGERAEQARETLQRWLDETPRYQGDDPRALHYRHNREALETAIAALATPAPVGEPQPIDMILFCPKCGLKHVDEPDERTPDWTNPPHKSHLCHGCGTVWRPADIPTNGVAALKTVGKADTFGLNALAALALRTAPVGEEAVELGDLPLYITGRGRALFYTFVAGLESSGKLDEAGAKQARASWDEAFKRAVYSLFDERKASIPSPDRLRESAEALANFAWSAVTADCEESRAYLQSLLDNLRAALASPNGVAEGPYCLHVSDQGPIYVHGRGPLGEVMCRVDDGQTEDMMRRGQIIVDALNAATLPKDHVAEGWTAQLFEAIQHGDEDHRAWLREAIEAFAAGLPVPAPRGGGRKEARIAELEARLAAVTQPSVGPRDE